MCDTTTEIASTFYRVLSSELQTSAESHPDHVFVLCVVFVWPRGVRDQIHLVRLSVETPLESI